MASPPPPPPAHPHFGPIDSDIHILGDQVDDNFEQSVDYEHRSPGPQHRMDAMSLEDDFEELRLRGDRLGSPESLPASKDYLYYRLIKDGEDWGSAIKKSIDAPVDQIEKKAKKGKGGDGLVLDQLTRMGQLRRDVIEAVVRKANARETGDAHWEVVYIKSKRVQTRAKKIEIPEMDVILSRSKGRSRSRARPKSFAGNIVQVGDARRYGNGKQYVDDDYRRPRKDSVLAKLDDPIANLPLFESDGRPRDDLGPIHFNNANLPPEIPKERPLGTLPEKSKDKRDKSAKGSKSRERGHAHDDDVYIVPEAGDFADGGDAPRVEAAYPDDKSAGRGRQGKSPHQHPVVVEDHRRSHSRHRQPGSRGISREKSQSRRGSVHIPNSHTRKYFDEDTASSENSDSSHLGFVEYAESSNTSLGTPSGVPRRGSLVHNPVRVEATPYKTHHPGPSRSVSYNDRPYHGDHHAVVPGQSRRDSFIVYNRPQDIRQERPLRLVRHYTAPIPEDRRIVYHDHPAPSRTQDIIPIRRYVSHDTGTGPLVHYHQDDPDVYYRDELDNQSVRIEDYQRDRVRAEYVRDKERRLRAHEQELEMMEEDLRRLRHQRDKEYYDDRDRRDSRESVRVFFDPRTGKYYHYVD